jgi:hypothetical protein
MIERLFSNQLRKLYKIDKMLIKLKAERKELLEVIEHNKIETQGHYRLVKDGRESRAIKIEEYKKIVSEEEFLRSAIVPVKNALKYLSEKDLSKVSYKKIDYNYYVVKD